MKKLLLLITLLLSASLYAQQQKGVASYYAKRATGAITSSGEKLHHDSMTCAHRSYPFGTRLRVTCPATGKSVVVRVTDRGPFAKGRIIDLSWGAARELGMLNMGIASVYVEVVKSQTALGPVKKQEPFEMPEIDFAVNEAGFLFLPEIKKNTIEQERLPLKKGQTKTTPPQQNTENKTEKKTDTSDNSKQKGTPLHSQQSRTWKNLFNW